MTQTDPAAWELLHRASRALEVARATPDPDERYVVAHLAALRVAGAVLAARGRPGVRRRTGSAWDRVRRGDDRWAGWADHFAACATTRSRAESGTGVVSPEQADEQVVAAERFRGEVARDLLGAASSAA